MIFCLDWCGYFHETDEQARVCAEAHKLQKERRWAAAWKALAKKLWRPSLRERFLALRVKKLEAELRLERTQRKALVESTAVWAEREEAATKSAQTAWGRLEEARAEFVALNVALEERLAKRLVKAEARIKELSPLVRTLADHLESATDALVDERHEDEEDEDIVEERELIQQARAAIGGS